MGVHYTLFYGSLAALPPLAGLARDVTGVPGAARAAGVVFLLIALAAVPVYLEADTEHVCHDRPTQPPHAVSGAGRHRHGDAAPPAVALFPDTQFNECHCWGLFPTITTMRTAALP